MMSRQIFILRIISILSVLFFYTHFKAAQLLIGKEALAWTLSGLFVGLIVAWQMTYRFCKNALETRWFPILAWTGSFGMGLWGTFVTFSIPFDLFHGLTSLLKMNSSHPWIPLSLFGISIGIVSLGYLEVIGGPRIQEVLVPIPGIPPALRGIRIVQISDLHVGSTIDQNYVHKVVKKTMSLRPDLIAITGDLIDGTPELLSPHLRPLSELKAPLGTFYVTGNHEYYWGAESWVEKTKQLGFIPLINENRVVNYEGVKILVGGVTDPSGDQFVPSHRSNPVQASASPEAEHCAFKLLLAHRPDTCLETGTSAFDLQLSGHTHAGQFFPWSLIVRLAHQYYRGLHRHGKMWVYVNAGTGYWGPAHRFLVPAEISLIRLTSNAVSDPSS